MKNFRKANWKQYRQEINNKLHIKRVFANKEQLKEKIKDVTIIIQEATKNNIPDLTITDEKLAEEIMEKIKELNHIPDRRMYQRHRTDAWKTSLYNFNREIETRIWSQ